MEFPPCPYWSRYRISVELVKLLHQRMKLAAINNIIGLLPFMSCGVQSAIVHYNYSDLSERLCTC